MGFRSVFITDDFGNETLPEWFVEKYRNNCHFFEDCRFPVSAKWEAKTYGVFVELEKDLQKAVDWEFDTSPLVVVWLHECGGITRSQIHAEKILRAVPKRGTPPHGIAAGWAPIDVDDVDSYGHHYCYGCTDFEELAQPSA